MNPNSKHNTNLTNLLKPSDSDIKPNGVYVDATLGGAGHSEYLLSKLGENGHLYAFDQDQLRILQEHSFQAQHS